MYLLYESFVPLSGEDHRCRRVSSRVVNVCLEILFGKIRRALCERNGSKMLEYCLYSQCNSQCNSPFLLLD